MRIWMLLIVVVVAAIVGGALMVDEGDVVTLTTIDDEGMDRDTHLWIVQLDGHSYLRAGSEDVKWLRRLTTVPQVSVRRGLEGKRTPMLAHVVADASTAHRVSEAMAAKYGASDRLWSRISSRDGAVAVRLDPVDHAGLSPSMGSPH